MGRNMTSNETLALDLSFRFMGETPFNRSMDDYIAIAARAPALKILHAYVNDVLEQMAVAGRIPYSIGLFKAGDRRTWTEMFPTRLSIETVRQAWKKSGMRDLQRHARLQKRQKKSLKFRTCFY